MGGGQSYRPTPQEAAPKEEDPAVQKRKAARATQQRYAQGFSSTIATDRSAMGGTGTPAAPGSVEKLG